MDGQPAQVVDRRTERVVFLIALALGIYPPALTFLARGVAGAFSFFAADAFYYLAVAEHSTGIAGYSYDGSLPTNGFHPLWQYLLWAAFRSLGLQGASQIVFAFWASALASAVGGALFATALLRLTRRPFLAIIGAVPGIFYAFCLPFHAHYGASWSYANGMESGLSILFFGVLARGLFAHGPPANGDLGGTLRLSSLIGLATLARLDDVFLLVPFVGAIVLGGGSRREKGRAAAVFLAPAVLLVAAYLAYNLSYSGMLLPTSGTAKAGLALGNFSRLFTPLWPRWLFTSDYAGWRHEVWRVLQLGAPLLACGWFVLRFHRGRQRSAASPAERALLLLSVFVVAKGLYNLCFVKLWHQGHWYFPLSVMTFNALAVHHLEQRAATQPAGNARRALVFSVVGVLLLGNALVFAKRTEGYNQKYFDLWSRREEIERALHARGLTQGVIDFDDGILSYSLHAPALSGLGLALDAESQRARSQGKLFQLAYARGYRLMASLNYPAVPREMPLQRLEPATLHAEYLRGQDIASLRFDLVYRDPDTGLAFIRFAPRD